MKALGIILAGGNSQRMRNLSEKRAISAMPIACSYRSIDFSLSNMTNSGIQTVAVLSQYNARSLNEHLNSAKWWNFGRKQGGLFLFTPTVTADNSWWYRGTADAMWQNIDFLKRRHEPYVVISSGDCVYKMDFAPVLEYHVQKQADITIVCARVPEDEDISRFGTVKIDADGLVTTGTYIIRRRKLIELLEQCNREGRYNFVTDILVRYKGMKKIYGWMLEDYWSNISTVESYYKTNMDFLKPEVQDFFFREQPTIYSKAADLPPAKFNVGSNVKNSLIGSGCIINSNVEGSVIFKRVFIGNNSTVKNSIILNGAYVGDNVHVENCIVESNETLLSDQNYIGDNEIKVVFERQNRYGV